MFYHFLYSFAQSHIGLNVFRYITFRSFVAFLLAVIISVFMGRSFIAFMKKKQFGQIIRNNGPETHFKKAGTPTMGGVIIIVSVLLTMLFCGNFLSLPVILTLGVFISYAVLGYCDDYLKVLKKNTDGISVKMKLVWQILTGLIVGYLMVHYNAVDTKIYLPFLKDAIIDLKFFYILFVALVIVGSSNAVNLTDGLDGLAIGPIMTSAATLGLLAYVAGHKELASYLYIPYVDNVGELMVIAACIVGAGVGFLWYNSYPAQIFMGDVGSLSLGGVLGSIAVLTKNEILYVLIGGLFVVEAVSVILQVGSYKLRKKRIFKMAPIHHHFELKGWPEPKVIVRFWIISIGLAILSLATLKMR